VNYKSIILAIMGGAAYFMQCEVFAGERGYYAVAVDISGVPKLWGSPAYMYYTDDSVVSDENMPDPNEKCWSKRKSGDYRISIFARKKRRLN